MGVFVGLLLLGIQVVNGVTNDTTTVDPTIQVPQGMSILDPGTVMIYQSDYLDSNFASFGVNSEVTSCYISGRGGAAWWKFVMNETQLVQGFLFKGFWDGLLKFRVGTHHSSTGEMAGHRANIPCTEILLEGWQDFTLFKCQIPVEGNVISVDARTPEPGLYSNLQICDVKVLV